MDSKKKALIISVSDYEENPNFDSLKICENDGNAMYETLKEAGFEILDSHKIVGNVDKKTIEDSIINFFREDVNPIDTLLFYYTGHGYVDEYSDGFFCTSEIEINLPQRKGVKFKFLTEQMNKSLSQKKIAILDCCNSGETLQSEDEVELGPIDKEAKAVEKGRGSIQKTFVRDRQDADILASSLSNKASFGLTNQPYSAFTYYILEGLKKNKETVDEKGDVTPEKLFLYVAQKLIELQGADSQKPIKYFPIRDKLVLAEYPEIASSFQETLKKNEKLATIKVQVSILNDPLQVAAILIKIGERAKREVRDSVGYHLASNRRCPYLDEHKTSCRCDSPISISEGVHNWSVTVRLENSENDLDFSLNLFVQRSELRSKMESEMRKITWVEFRKYGILYPGQEREKGKDLNKLEEERNKVIYEYQEGLNDYYTDVS